jgi:hypothetical protein
VRAVHQAGNSSFILALAAFCNTDMLYLRLLAMGSISLSIIFQFYRAMPLWIPIRWNVLLLAINAIMAGSLAYETHQAEYMPTDFEGLYKKAFFEQRGFNKVEFCRLFAIRGNESL